MVAGLFITPISLCAGTAASGLSMICGAQYGRTTNPDRIPATTQFDTTSRQKEGGPVTFGRVVESGSHQASLQMILERRVHASAIDSTVLEMEFSRNPSMAKKVRAIAVLGPSPAPPWVVHRSVPHAIRVALRREFLSMDKDQQGRRILEDAGILRFVRVSDHQYDPIREMDRIAARVEW